MHKPIIKEHKASITYQGKNNRTKCYLTHKFAFYRVQAYSARQTMWRIHKEQFYRVHVAYLYRSVNSSVWHTSPSGHHVLQICVRWRQCGHQVSPVPILTVKWKTEGKSNIMLPSQTKIQINIVTNLFCKIKCHLGMDNKLHKNRWTKTNKPVALHSVQVHGLHDFVLHEPARSQ